MLKNVLVIALGLVLSTTILTGINITANLISPYKTFQNLENMPNYSRNQNFEINEFQPVVRLEKKATFFSEQEFFCSGTVISNDYVLTAAHCVGSMHGELSTDTIIIKGFSTAEGSSAVLEVEAIAAAMNGRADYALVKGDFSRFTKTPVLTNMDQHIGDLQGPFLTCGYPWGAGRVCYGTTPGSLAPYLQYFIMQGILYPGMSGGPVYDAGLGMIVGVNSAMAEGAIILSPLVGLFETLKVQVVD